MGGEFSPASLYGILPSLSSSL
jgi:hypothetical protein